MTKVMITGATGFLGQALVESLIPSNKFTIVATSRRQLSYDKSHIVSKIVSSLDKETDWSSVLKGVDIVVHTAARVHIMSDAATEPLVEFRKINLEGTMALAQQAVEASVKRFIFISSIKVNGEETEIDKPFTEDDIPNPLDPYGISKSETEQTLLALSAKTGLEVVIIRPVLVYGPNVKANFLNMIEWLNRGIPLPFGCIKNKRSLVALENLVSFIVFCVDYKNTPKAANQVFLISDGEDVSTTELLKKTAKALGIKALLIPLPVWLMVFGAKLLDKGEVANRLFGSLQVDSSKARDLLGWKPVISMDEQLKKTAEEYFINEKAF